MHEPTHTQANSPVTQLPTSVPKTPHIRTPPWTHACGHSWTAHADSLQGPTHVHSYTSADTRAPWHYVCMYLHTRPLTLTSARQTHANRSICAHAQIGVHAHIVHTHSHAHWHVPPCGTAPVCNCVYRVISERVYTLTPTGNCLQTHTHVFLPVGAAAASTHVIECLSMGDHWGWFRGLPLGGVSPRSRVRGLLWATRSCWLAFWEVEAQARECWAFGLGGVSRAHGCHRPLARGPCPRPPLKASSLSPAALTSAMVTVAPAWPCGLGHFGGHPGGGKWAAWFSGTLGSCDLFLSALGTPGPQPQSHVTSQVQTRTGT